MSGPPTPPATHRCVSYAHVYNMTRAPGHPPIFYAPGSPNRTDPRWTDCLLVYVTIHGEVSCQAVTIRDGIVVPFGPYPCGDWTRAARREWAQIRSSV